MTWLLLRKTYADAAKAKALVQFVWWAETEGQAKAPALGYAPLPTQLRPWIQARLRSITGGGRVAWGGSDTRLVPPGRRLARLGPPPATSLGGGCFRWPVRCT